MRNIKVNIEWKFKDAVDNIEALRYEYEGTLTLFSYFDLKQRNKFILETRNKIYALKFEEWKRDKLWEYMNGFENLETLKKIR